MELCRTPSNMLRDSFVPSAVVEWKTLKLCFLIERGMYVVIVSRTNLSGTLTGFLNNGIGLCGEGSVEFLFDFSIGMIFPTFLGHCYALLYG